MNFFSQLVFPEQHKTDANRILNKKINKKKQNKFPNSGIIYGNSKKQSNEI